MSRYRKGAGGKRDENEPDIIKVLRAHGCVVMQLSGKGIPDLLVLRNGTKWLADVKMPGKPTTEAQEELWEEAATKARCSVFILRTPEDAQKMLNNALQPWEPDHFKLAAARRVAKRIADYPVAAFHEQESARTDDRQRKGDAAKAQRKIEAAQVLEDKRHSRPSGLRYTPPRSKPVDAAKEAEATFAPPPFQHHSRCTYEGGGLCSCPAGWKG